MALSENEAITITSEQWTEEAHSLIKWAFPNLSAADADTMRGIKHSVCTGKASLFIARLSGVAVLAYVLSVEGKEGVVLVAAGNVPGVDLTAIVLPEIEKKFIGCESVRIHTARPGLAKKLAKQGYGAKEIVLVKKL